MKLRLSLFAFISVCFAVTLTTPVLSTAQVRAASQRLDDATFWNLISEMSEPDGDFEDENYVSNEIGHHHVLPRLLESIATGGVYVGVGPEQNFTYIAALEPEIAFIIDIRRQNMLEHLIYKALFEIAESRTDFLSLLFSRPLPEGLGANSHSDDLFRAYGAVASDRDLFQNTLDRVLDRLTTGRGFELSTEDMATIEKVLNAFYEGGPDIMYVFRGTAEPHPTYARLMRLEDDSGRNWSYLGSEENFLRVREMQLANRIVPVAGDFGGPTAVRAVGAYVRETGLVVDVFYFSNVEPYLFADGTWREFYENLLTLPVNEHSVFVRTFFGSTARECASLRPPIRTPVISRALDFLAAYRNGEVENQCALVERSNE